MSSPTFGWESLLQTDAPKGSSLKAGLFTTYDRADERLLVEHLLPLLLNLDPEPEVEGTGRLQFLIKLGECLKQLHGKLVVVSSTMRDEAPVSEMENSSAYGWIWSSIRQLTVGYQGKAVQHAKLWLLLWGKSDESNAEYLEIVVSSANLTHDAFKGQLQGAWRACLKLHGQSSKARLSGWGLLPDFLQQLAISAGEADHFSKFIELLARADCPVGVTFVASVPGTHSRQVLRRTPWGAAGLRQVIPAGQGIVNVSILSPFVGAWNDDSLTRWCNRFGGAPDHLKMVWIDKHHPWAEKWVMPDATLKAFSGAGAKLLHLRRAPEGSDEIDPFHKEHRQADPRWSHAKIYSFKRGTSRRGLLTSANFGAPAWGIEDSEGGLRIKNFELGVCLAQVVWPFDSLANFGSGDQPATVEKLPPPGSSFIMWAQAVWNGKTININCRCDKQRALAGEIKIGNDWMAITKWTLREDNLREARVRWTDAKQTPTLIRLTCEKETVSLSIFDERPWQARKDTFPPEIDEAIAQLMRDELLFEQYGGRVATEDDLPENEDDPPEDEDDQSKEGGDKLLPGDTNGGDSYDVPAFELARYYFGIVDNWATKAKSVELQSNNEFEREVVRRDGQLLIEAFQRKNSVSTDMKDSALNIGAKLAAEELSQRLLHFPET